MNAKTVSCWSSLLLLLLLAACQQQLANAIKMVGCDIAVDLFRLPTHVRPLNYNLKLELDPNKEDFSGKVDIVLQFNQEMDSVGLLSSRSISGGLHPYTRDRKKIILNADGLDVYDAEFLYFKGGLRVERICSDARNKIIVIELSEIPDPQRYAMLTLCFRGRVQTRPKGLFRSFVESSPVLATHFESNYARQVFPCFDEPEFKATFDLIIEHPVYVHALSNMPIIDTATPDNLGITYFERTPKMSSYLLGLAVGCFEANRIFFPLTQPNKLPITIYAPKGCINQSSDMLKKANKAYDRVIEFFAGLPQPLRKIDIVAVEMELAAMENWGLITMKSDLLCTHEKMLQPQDRNYAVTVITNMMVRFWLGNLVTVAWWDDMWFVEGLANYLTSELTNKLFPEINSELYTLLDTTVTAMIDDDNRQKTRPIARKDLKTADEIQNSIDVITDKKPEALFRMFARFLGKDKFNLAIRDLIQLKAEGLIRVDDWWSNLADRVYPQYKMMLYNTQLWTGQAGYPIISVSKITGRRLRVSQKSNLGDDKFWQVPISYEIHYPTEDHMDQKKFVLTNLRPKEIGLPNGFNPDSSGHWLKLNPDCEGYYRVVYKSPSLRKALAKAVESGRMKPADRLQLLSDSYDHAKRSVSMRDFGKLLKSYSRETNDGVVLLLTGLLFELYNIDSSLALSDEVKSLMVNYHTLNGGVRGGAGSNVLAQCARGNVLHYLVVFLKNENAIADARKYKTENGELPPFFKHVDPYLSTSY